MVTFRSLVIPVFSLIILLTKVDALQYRSVRQTTTDECPNVPNNACLFVTCENNGLCIPDSSTTDCFRCQCASGYTGKMCDMPIAIIPAGCNPGCQNGGFCNINVCVCSGGYTGMLCETRDFCYPSNPCQNGGRCTSTGVSYTCNCLGTGYTGTVCTDVIPTNPCASNPCQNGGQCSSVGGTMNCACVNGYIGLFCQIPPIPCATTPCENGGKCELLATNSYGCVCPEEYTGVRCETSIYVNHPCVTMPSSVCLNGGVCTMNGANYLCKCAAGWSGPNCQTQETTSSCNSSPCGIHGTCYEINLPMGPIVYCSCENRWTGKNCDINMDVSCPVGYCLSGGTCVVNGNALYCNCPPSYTGLRCESFVGLPTTTPPLITYTPVITTVTSGGQACLPNPCENGGICYGNTDAFRCECPPPWAGPTCTMFLVTITTPGMITTSSPGGNICSPSPCMNGGYCYPSGSSFQCSCPSSFTGLLCETFQTTTLMPYTTPGVPGTCAQQPCKNGATCVTMGTSYSCFCGLTSNYTGKNCDSTTPMTVNECPLDCAPGRCIFSGNAQKPYACLWNGLMRPIDGTAG